MGGDGSRKDDFNSRLLIFLLLHRELMAFFEFAGCWDSRLRWKTLSRFRMMIQRRMTVILPGVLGTSLPCLSRCVNQFQTDLESNSACDLVVMFGVLA